MWISLKLFFEFVLETTAHFKRLPIEILQSPRATASKQKMQNIVMTTVDFSRETLKNVCGHLRKQTSPFILSIQLIPKGRDTGRLPLYPIILWLLVSLHILDKVTDCISEFVAPRAVFWACIQTSTTSLIALHAKNKGNRRLLKWAIFFKTKSTHYHSCFKKYNSLYRINFCRQFQGRLTKRKL